MYLIFCICQWGCYNVINMDIFSHGLWVGAAYKAINKKLKKSFNVWLAFFWGVIPDVASFGVLFVFLAYNLIFAGMSFSDFPRPEQMEPIQSDTIFIFRLVNTLYNITHSVIIFAAIFGLMFLILKRPLWEMIGWLLHILIDIPTHSYQFYPTPFLWPLSGWKFNGFSWGTPWFLIANYAIIVIVYFLLRNRNSRI